MNFEQPKFMGTRMERDKGGDKEEESTKSILEDPEREDIKIAVMERSGEEELIKKLVARQAPDESEFEDLAKIANEVKRVDLEVKQMETVFGDGKLFNEIATADKDFGKWQSLVGSENMGDFYNKEYFVKLCLDDRSGFKKIKNKIEQYSKTKEKIQEVVQELEIRANQLSEKFKIPQRELRNIFNMDDDVGRDIALKALVKGSIKPLLFAKDKRSQVYNQLQGVLLDGDNFVKDLRGGSGILGRQEKRSLKGVANSLLKDEEWKEAAGKKAGEIFIGESPEKKEKTMSFSAASKMVKEDGKQKVREDWASFQRENAGASAGSNPGDIANYWKNISGDKLKSKQDEFLGGMKKEQGGGYWWELVIKIANFDLTKEIKGS